MSKVLADVFTDVSQFAACEQCGLCSSACPVTGITGYNVRRILRHVELGLVDEIAATEQAWECTTCGRCESVCPNGVAILDIIRPLRALARGAAKHALPAPCQRACPGDIDVPGYLRHIANGDPARAYAVILDAVPFPGTLGRVCTHPCETACTRTAVNEPIAICALKRYAADHAGAAQAATPAVAADSGKRVAVVGAGPAGLTCAYYLRRKGHAVTIFESRAEAGGMMRYGIPRYRLPAAVLDAEIEQILRVGIELRTGARVGSDVTLTALGEQGFDAIFVAAGLQAAKRITVEGADQPGVSWGVDFLAEVAAGTAAPTSGRVVVVGGGDVAIDVAMSVRRLGASEVTIVCLEGRDEMPAHPWEVEAALAEGIAVENSWGPQRIIAGADGITAIELIACAAVFDSDGRFAPRFATDTRTMVADQVILAVGQDASFDFAAGADLPATAGLLVTDGAGAIAGRGWLFAGGEISTGPGALIDAIADGKRIARAVDSYLGGDGKLSAASAEAAPTTDYDGKRPPGFADRSRAPVPELDVAERQGFIEVSGCMSDAGARAEAERCLQCDLEARPERL